MPPNDPTNPPDPTGPSPPRPEGPGEATAEGSVADWCRAVDGLLRLAHASGPGAAPRMAGPLAGELVRHVERHGELVLELTPRSVLLDGVPVFEADPVRARARDLDPEPELAWLLHRDGVRRVRFRRGLEAAEVETLLGSLVAMTVAPRTHEDLVTLLWDAAPPHVRLETEEASAVRHDPLRDGRDEPEPRHASDWPLPPAPAADLKRLWQDVQAREARDLEDLRSLRRREREAPFADAVEALVARLRAADPRPETAEALAASVVTWIATAVQRGEWAEALRALDLLRRLDPGRRHADEFLAHALGALDGEAITRRLDGASHADQGRFFAFAVGVGAPALPLLVAALAHSAKVRVRAGATTALAHAFADDPAPLAPWLADTRWHVVRNVVFALGQIGGAAVVPLLAQATRHLDVRVRRAAVHALGQVPPAWRRPVLLAQLDAQDVRLLSATLAMLARDPDARIAESLLARVLAPEFAVRPEEARVLLISAIPELAGDVAVPALEELLARGGWFAGPSLERTAAAQALRRIGTPAARDALEHGLRHRSAAVREACGSALASEASA